MKEVVIKEGKLVMSLLVPQVKLGGRDVGVINISLCSCWRTLSVLDCGG
jgi:hypothetical protein